MVPLTVKAEILGLAVLVVLVAKSEKMVVTWEVTKPVILARTALVQLVVQEQRNLHLVLVEYPQEQVLQVVFLNCVMG